MAAARVREARRHPGHLGPDDLAVPGQAVDEGGAAPGRRADRRVDRRPQRRRGRSTSPNAIGFPLILKPRAGAGAQGTTRVDYDGRAARSALGGFEGVDSIAVEEFVQGHEGFYDTIAIEGRVVHDWITHYYPNVLEAMRERWISPQFVTTNRIDDSPLYAEVREMGARVIDGTRHSHVGDPHGVVPRTQGSAVLRDRLPAARRRGLGPVLRGQRRRRLPRVGARHRPRGTPERPLSRQVLRRHRRPAPGPGRPRSHGHSGPRRRPTVGTASGSSTPTFPTPAPEPSLSRPATWPTPTSGCVIRTTTRCGGCSTTSGGRCACTPDDSHFSGPNGSGPRPGTVVRSLEVEGSYRHRHRRLAGPGGRRLSSSSRRWTALVPTTWDLYRAADRRPRHRSTTSPPRRSHTGTPSTSWPGIYSQRLQHALDSVYAVQRRAVRADIADAAFTDGIARGPAPSTPGSSPPSTSCTASCEMAAPIGRERARATASWRGRRDPALCPVRW